jgi:hypothetical protein
VTEETKPQEQGIEDVIPKGKPKWKLVNQIGRSQRPIREGDEAKMREEYDRVIKAGIPGSILLLDDTGKIAEQHSGFANEKTRHGMAEDGSPYEPAVVERGHPNFDLGAIAEAIKSQPETDPDAEPEPSTANSIEDSGAETERRTKELSDRLKEVEAALHKVSKQRPEVESAEPMSKPPTGPSRPFARGPFGREVPRGPKIPPPRGERMRGQPCGGGLTGLLSFLQAANVYYSQMQASQRRIARRHRRFGFEMLIRLISGAPVCESTVHASYSDAQEATRM